MAYLVDISNWNTPDWDAFKHKLVGVYNKEGEGLTWHDPTYGRNRATAAARRIPFGAYYFHHPKYSGVAQAQAFLAGAKPRPGDLRPVIDTETSDDHSYGDIGRNVLVMAQTIRAAGINPILYASQSWIQRLVSASPGLKNFDWWQAEYGPRLHRVPGVRYVMWQFTDKMVVGKGRFDGDLLLVRNLTPLLIPRPKPPAPKPKPKPVPAPKPKPAPKPPVGGRPAGVPTVWTKVWQTWCVYVKGCKST